MTSENLCYLGSDPGAVKLGNFINYYSFHSPKQRINNLDVKMFLPPSPTEPYLCLDVGCNTGELSEQMYRYLKKEYPASDIKVLAIDIDPTLIKRAQESSEISNITFLTANIMLDKDRATINEYLNSYQKKAFDVIFCFSVSMWIHLNNGDDGLLDFIKYIKCISESIIIEPQPWKCYRTAQRRLKKSGSTFPLYESLTIRTEVETVIEKMISEKTHSKVYGSLNPSWNRKILSFHKVQDYLFKCH